jgi:hypothetical protein
MNEIDFVCPHCGQELSAPAEYAGETIDCPACQQSFTVPAPGAAPAPAAAPAAPAPAAPAPQTAPASEEEKGKTVRIELPPEFLAEPEKLVFKIKRVQH